MLVDGSELVSIAEGLLEVVADHLLELPRPRAGCPLQPLGEALVQLAARLLRHRVVCSLAEQDVAEAERLVAREERSMRPDQLPADERLEVDVDGGTRRLGRRIEHRSAPELLADHRRALEHCPLLRVQPIEACGEQRLNGRRHGELALRAVLAQHPEHLFEEERIPLGRLGGAPQCLFGKLLSAGDRLDQRRGLAPGEWAEGNRRRVELSSAP